MTEAEWQTCEDWPRMLAFLSDRWTSRKATLYLCAGLRSLWNLLYSESSRSAVEVAERAADGTVSEDEISRAAWGAECPTFGYDFEPEFIQKMRAEYGVYVSSVQRLMEMGVYTEDDLQGGQTLGDDRTRSCLLRAARIAEKALYIKSGKLSERLLGELSTQEKWPKEWLVREIVGNPFRPVVISLTWLTWNDGTIPKFAQAIYDDRAFDRLPILADALEDAGCDNADILNHCREPGKHVRGCWVIDLLLGKQ